jgi:hypothetical protein
MGKLSAAVVLALFVVGCSGSGSGSANVSPPPSDVPPTADAGTPDSGTPDAGTVDAGTPDAGAGLTPGSLGVGPWPTGNVTYGSQEGIQESPIVGMTTDESQNLWVATQSALYLMKPGQTHFTRFAAADGLHLPGNGSTTCFDWTNNIAKNGLSNNCEHTDANPPGISEITGGGPNEVFVGYWSLQPGNLGVITGSGDPSLPDGTPVEGTKFDPTRHSGKLDRVRLQADGKLDVVRFDVVSSDQISFWHNRDVERMVYDHFIHRHELYVGMNHGVNKLTPDNWETPPANTWFLTSYNHWMADHLHPQVCFHASCAANDTQMLGDWRGLAVDLDGDLWVGGRWAAGEIRYTNIINPTGEQDWIRTPRHSDGKGAFRVAFGDPYNGPSQCGTDSAPVFCPPLEGDPVNISAIAVTPDGTTWFSSGTLFHDSRDVPYGIARLTKADPHHFSYFSTAQVGLGESDVRDMVALPDGRLVIAGLTTGLVFWDPATGKHVQMHAGQGIPDDRIMRLELDQMVSPPVLHVATAGGAASIRVFPK